MSFSSEWEQRYAESTHLSVWPWSDVVSLVHRHLKPILMAGGGRVLELGSGAGANIPLFISLGMDYYGIEGSPTIVKKLHQRYPDLIQNIIEADFTTRQPFEGRFDLVLDRASLTHNNTVSIRSALQIVSDALKPDGIFIGSDWFSMNHSDFLSGEAVDDDFTRTAYSKGQFTGVGKVHFSNALHLRDLFSNFEILFIEEKLMRRYEPQDNHQFASWNIVARKPHA
ncbi:MAG: class I SAM-dependent methyltransferase [Candidatus Accumulibacter phosphatis]|uniref:Class I SAM-dependent methyltransferase n=4 Tax=Candidatus Accumulibacter TaxID=327159 RepID=A0A7D5NBR7_9PROT|nr:MULTISPECIES: class I SAM-dependent methyltransferase [Candidatus Accumulibacter]MCC2869291.1 class I SAM-dependent methyltransferase [Candidatus Accumulibacter phosphatis]MBL8400119.1 class I SAM-dependent methyltransferase [Accumulibacter sp.]MBN8517363.1 class I SAM-dependent methyltransferase [Accumulibacter sp.]MBO3710765.1 class I SAM-dependent methyltransferase [Accumulibacter sp.]MCQ1549624.1 class I SAM-dependent methyltransferase [Candidatus Accumulibacter phosphatis]